MWEEDERKWKKLKTSQEFNNMYFWKEIWLLPVIILLWARKHTQWDTVKAKAEETQAQRRYQLEKVSRGNTAVKKCNLNPNQGKTGPDKKYYCIHIKYVSLKIVP